MTEERQQGQAGGDRSSAPASPAGSGEVTALLRSWALGSSEAQERLFRRVYPELRDLAGRRLARQRGRVSLQATDLANEAYLALERQNQVDWSCRAQFFALASTLIRRILLDRAKHHLRQKRGGGAVHLSLEEVRIAGPGFDIDVLALDQALRELASFQPTAARIVELRFFGGLQVAETASVLNLATATVVRKWRFARVWLAERLGP